MLFSAQGNFSVPPSSHGGLHGEDESTCDDSVSLTSSFVKIDGQWVQYMDMHRGPMGNVPTHFRTRISFIPPPES
jgi:hypothetical protein